MKQERKHEPNISPIFWAPGNRQNFHVNAENTKEENNERKTCIQGKDMSDMNILSMRDG